LVLTHQQQLRQAALSRQSLFAKICQCSENDGMSTMNISLPQALKSFVDEQVSNRGFGTSSEYVRELIRKDQERLQLRELLLAGGRSTAAAAADGAYFAALRDRIGGRTAV
jgi:antitoxin ParD1/3/4